MVVIFLIAYLLIAATFAPSVYGQSYPVARARFAGRVLMTSALMINGALLGILAANTRMRFFQSTSLRRFATLVLSLHISFPLRGAGGTSKKIHLNKQRPAAGN